MPETMPSKWSNANRGQYNESYVDTSETDESDIGPGSSRETTTKELRRFSYTVSIDSKAEYESFRTFVRSVNGRVSIFNWYHQPSDTLLSVKFESMPSLRPVADIENEWFADIVVAEV